MEMDIKTRKKEATQEGSFRRGKGVIKEEVKENS